MSLYTDNFNRGTLSWATDDGGSAFYIDSNRLAFSEADQYKFHPQPLTEGAHQFAEIDIAVVGSPTGGRAIPGPAIQGPFNLDAGVWLYCQAHSDWLSMFQKNGAGYVGGNAYTPNVGDRIRLHTRDHPTVGGSWVVQVWVKRAGDWTWVSEFTQSPLPNGYRIGLSSQYAPGDARLDNFSFGNWDGVAWEGEPGETTTPTMIDPAGPATIALAGGQPTVTTVAGAGTLMSPLPFRNMATTLQASVTGLVACIFDSAGAVVTSSVASFNGTGYFVLANVLFTVGQRYRVFVFDPANGGDSGWFEAIAT